MSPAILFSAPNAVAPSALESYHPRHIPPLATSTNLRKWRPRKFWSCRRWPACEGSHGAHADGEPYGIPGDAATKAARILAHEAFDRLWKDSEQPQESGRLTLGQPRRSPALMTRRDAYRWLQDAMGLEEREAHIGRFTVEQCERLIILASDYRPAPRLRGGL